MGSGLCAPVDKRSRPKAGKLRPRSCIDFILQRIRVKSVWICQIAPYLYPQIVFITLIISAEGSDGKGRFVRHRLTYYTTHNSAAQAFCELLANILCDLYWL